MSRESKQRVVSFVDTREMKERTWLGIIALAVIVLVAMVAFAGTASGLNPPAECKTYHNHSGYLPSQYDFGIFIEKSPAVEIRSTHSENPREYGAGNRWDIVHKCKYQTTTTTSIPTTTTTSVTTTSVPETTTTTVSPTTTTSVVETTTTTEPSTTTTTQAPSTTTTTETSSTTTSTTQPTTSTTVPNETTTTQPEELPYTGTADTLLLAAASSALIATGVATVKAVRSDENQA